LEDGGTDERVRSEGMPSENAWPRSQTADGGRARKRQVQGRIPSLEDRWAEASQKTMKIEARP
jgi:hypothetical protein